MGEFFDNMYAPAFKRMAKAKPRVKINKTGDPELDLIQEMLVARAAPTVENIEETQRTMAEQRAAQMFALRARIAKKLEAVDVNHKRKTEVAERQEGVRRELRPNLWTRLWKRLRRQQWSN